MSVVAFPSPRDLTGSTIAAAVERFLESRTAATTRAGYAETLTHLTAIIGPDHPVAELTPSSTPR
ncbi:hypothetical protein [Nonomuraea sp. NPDC049784]|uniref:hypothetical protein n=1 Tax=Nonomuraea sp. NPDC049784 TaxID=3154361 RepID=UPI003402A9C0